MFSLNMHGLNLQKIKKVKQFLMLLFKSNKLWADQGREFYNKPMQEWLVNNDIFSRSIQLYLLSFY